MADQPDMFCANEPRAYFDTTRLPQPELEDATATAKYQDAVVLAIFQSRDCPLSPSMVWKFGLERKSSWLLTSVRRSMSTLTKAGKLTKLPVKVVGIHGRREFIWEVVK
jgi:hypothetical protein